MPEQGRHADVRTTPQAWESLSRTQVAVMRRLQALPEFR
ncbi:MarR family transcriptional regulator, partial [Arthrobacter deserti]|nr:MarR family transcriptional regulator [Arthrobacter deserti]